MPCLAVCQRVWDGPLAIGVDEDGAGALGIHREEAAQAAAHRHACASDTAGSVLDSISINACTRRAQVLTFCAAQLSRQQGACDAHFEHFSHSQARAGAFRSTTCHGRGAAR